MTDVIKSYVKLLYSVKNEDSIKNSTANHDGSNSDDPTNKQVFMLIMST